MGEKHMISARRVGLAAWLVILVLCIPGFAQESAPSSDLEQRWSARASFGAARVHDHDQFGQWFDFRIGRTIGSPSFAVDVGLSGSNSRAEFGSLTGGLEVRPAPASRISP